MSSKNETKGETDAAELKRPVWAQPKNPGQRFAIRCPNSGFNGVRAGVRFLEGVGFTDDERAAATCRDFGYEVEDCKPAKK